MYGSWPLRQIAPARPHAECRRPRRSRGPAQRTQAFGDFAVDYSPSRLTATGLDSRARRAWLRGAPCSCRVRELTMSVARELELKLELTREEMQRVRGHPALGNLAVGEPVTRTLRSIYFDTPDYRLRALGISFRLRSDGDSWQQTVKSATAVANGGSKPIEAEGAVERPEPDLQVIGNRRIRRKVEKAVSRSILEPVFETVVQRTTRQLHSAEGDLELALDEGVVRAGSAENSLCEAELELKSGSPACLLQTAAQLFATAPVRLAKGSRTERGYSLALGKAN